MKKTLSLILSLAMALSLATPAFANSSIGSDAEDYNNTTVVGQDTAQSAQTEYYTDINSAGESTTTVYATKVSTFTALVPKTLILNGTAAFKGDYSISVRGDVADEDSVTINPKETNVTLTKVSGALHPTTTATVTQADGTFNGADIQENSWNKVITGSVEAPNLKAGSWKGTMIFDIVFNQGATTPTTPDTPEPPVEEPITYTDFTVTSSNRAAVGYTAAEGENLIIPATFVGDGNNETTEGVNYKVVGIDANAFYRGSKLASVSIPEGVTNIGEFAFYQCTSLTTVTIPDGVTNIGKGAFSGCKALTSVVIPDSVTNGLDYAFGGCTSLTSITISNNINNIGDFAFNSCTALSSIVISTNVTSIGNGAFKNCTSLTTINYEGTEEEWNTITKGTDWNNNCPADMVINYNYGKTPSEPEITYTNFTVTANNRAAVGYTGAEGEDLVIPATFVGDGNNGTTEGVNYKVTGIGLNAFKDCTALNSVVIPESVSTNLGYYAFQNCTSLTSVTIPEGVPSIGDKAFNGCTKLASISIPESVTSIGTGAFTGCKALTSITIPEGVTIIRNNIFSGCIELTSVTIPSGVTDIGSNAFSSCSKLNTINYAGTESQWNSISKASSWNSYCSADMVINYNYTA